VIKLTTDRYLTPNGRSIQDVGCTPDIELKPSKELTDNPILMGTDQDNQLQAAINFFHQKGIQ
jgi:C-terminal processing protease CtpA/Prc